MEQRLIDANALKKAINDNGCRHSHYFDIFDVIDNAPTIEINIYDDISEVTDYSAYPVSEPERPKGHWRSVGFEKGYAFCICSNCGNTTRLYRDSKNEFCCIADIRNKVIACLYCGADMRSVVDEGLHERAISDLSKAVDDAYKKARGDV